MPLGKKGNKDGDLETKKSSLFGRSKASKSSSAAPASNNPYAVPSPANDPYAASNANPYASQNAPKNDPYIRTQQSQSSLTQPPTSSFGSLSLSDKQQQQQPPSYGASNGYGNGPAPNRYEKSPVPSGGYGVSQPRYQSGGASYGQTGGYGSDPYGTGNSGQSRYGAGGYGGLGRTNSNDTMSTDAGRHALFADAAQKGANKPPEDLPKSGGDSSYNNTGSYDSAEMSSGYGAEPARELTAEEEEEQILKGTRTQIKDLKVQTVESTRRTIESLGASTKLGSGTLGDLRGQGERLHKTERNLDMASHQNRVAEEKAKELKTLGRSMFAVHVANPFTAKKNEEAANAIALDKHQRERAVADATRSEAYSSTARQQKQQREINSSISRQSNQRNLADRAKYQFEADSEDDELENEIDDNLDAIYRGAQTLNAIGKAMGDEIDSQNRHLDRIVKKTDKVDDQIAVNRARLDRIR